MKVLFLDIDGVLNSIRSCYALGGYPHSFEEKCMSKFDWTAIALIQRICNKSNVKIVVSSTWRKMFSYQEIGANLKLPTIDSTPEFSGWRGYEIKDWLDRHPEVTKYAIIDDDSDMLPEQKPFFVHVDGRNGISYENFKQLLEIFPETEDN